MVFNMGKINTNKPTNAVLINDNSVYSPNGIALNAMVALNAQVPLGGRDLKIGSKPESALIWRSIKKLQLYYSNCTNRK